jgi:tetratricopeptide (TPR) repeat protein
MITLSKLRVKAIAAAKNSDWQAAIEANQQILVDTPDDINALNRLGLACLQIGDTKQAKESFKKTLEIDKTNNIAKKQLERIAGKQAAVAPAFTREYFIEEPGKTKIVELHRLAGKQVLDQLSSGENCNLVLKKRFISIETDSKTYIGALPEDVSFRLSKLISSGNNYTCRVHSTTNNTCSVFLKELSRSKRNQDIHSFPINKSSMNQVSEMDDRFLLEDEDIPVQALEGDIEEELVSHHKNYEEIEPPEMGNDDSDD